MRYRFLLRAEVTIERDLSLEMRDGVTLRADICRPKADGKFPVLLTRTPYDKKGVIDFCVKGAARGYVVVAQDVGHIGVAAVLIGNFPLLNIFGNADVRNATASVGGTYGRTRHASFCQHSASGRNHGIGRILEDSETSQRA